MRPVFHRVTDVMMSSVPKFANELNKFEHEVHQFGVMVRLSVENSE